MSSSSFCTGKNCEASLAPLTSFSYVLCTLFPFLAQGWSLQGKENLVLLWELRLFTSGQRGVCLEPVTVFHRSSL